MADSEYSTDNYESWAEYWSNNKKSRNDKVCFFLITLKLKNVLRNCHS